MNPNIIMGTLNIVLNAALQPLVDAAMDRCAMVWAIVSRTTILPNQRCRRLNVSKGMPRILISGLFLPAIRKSGI
jgi:hypothetical protein